MTCLPSVNAPGVRHQREAATGYFDAVSEIVSQGQVRPVCVKPAVIWSRGLACLLQPCTVLHCMDSCSAQWACHRLHLCVQALLLRCAWCLRKRRPRAPAAAGLRSAHPDRSAIQLLSFRPCPCPAVLHHRAEGLHRGGAVLSSFPEASGAPTDLRLPSPAPAGPPPPCAPARLRAVGVRHQREAATGYFDAISEVVSQGLSSTTALKGSTETAQF